MLFDCPDVVRNPEHTFSENLSDLWKNQNIFELFTNLSKTDYL